MWQTSPEKASREALPRLGQIACQWRRPRKIRPDPTGIIRFLSSKTKQNIFDEFGGNSTLERLRRRLDKRGVRLLLDFVPNHTSLDHPWILHIPSITCGGTDAQLGREPQNYTTVETPAGPLVLAYRRNPSFPAGLTRCN